jgi:hypothetical protein
MKKTVVEKTGKDENPSSKMRFPKTNFSEPKTGVTSGVVTERRGEGETTS